MNKAIFWDLQGTLGGNATGCISDFEFYPVVYEALKMAECKGFYNIVITNQSRIGKGEMTMEEYISATNRLKKVLLGHGIVMKDWLCCPHTSKDNCSCKKPKTGLIDRCIKEYDIDRKESYVIGDMGKNEIIMARNAGCKGILVLTGAGKASLNEFRYTWSGYNADFIAENVLDAVRNI